MQLANRITVMRLVLVPVVVVVLLLYAHGTAAGRPVEELRWFGLGLFLLAAVSDLFDGYVARHYNQRSALGEILDPVADRLLLLATIVTLTFTKWPWTFPLWFPALILVRDLIALAGTLFVVRITGKVVISIHWLGKAGTFLQVCAVCWVLLGIQSPHPLWPTVLASIAIVLAGLIYAWAAVRQIRGRAVHT